MANTIEEPCRKLNDVVTSTLREWGVTEMLTGQTTHPDPPAAAAEGVEELKGLLEDVEFLWWSTGNTAEHRREAKDRLRAFITRQFRGEEAK